MNNDSNYGNAPSGYVNMTNKDRFIDMAKLAVGYPGILFYTIDEIGTQRSRFAVNGTLRLDAIDQNKMRESVADHFGISLEDHNVVIGGMRTSNEKDCAFTFFIDSLGPKDVDAIMLNGDPRSVDGLDIWNFEDFESLFANKDEIDIGNIAAIACENPGKLIYWCESVDPVNGEHELKGYMSVGYGDAAEAYKYIINHFAVQHAAVDIAREPMANNNDPSLLRVECTGFLADIISNDKRWLDHIEAIKGDSSGASIEDGGIVFVDATEWCGKRDLKRESRKYPGVLLYAIEKAGPSYGISGYASIDPGKISALHDACLGHFDIADQDLLLCTDGELDPCPVTISMSCLDRDFVDRLKAKSDPTDPVKHGPFKFQACRPGDLNGKEISDIALERPGVLIYYRESVDDSVGTSTIIGYLAIPSRDAIPAYNCMLDHFRCSRDFIDMRQERVIDNISLYRVDCVRCKPGTISRDTPGNEDIPIHNPADNAHARYSDMMPLFAVPVDFSERCIAVEGAQYQDLCVLEECAEVIKEITKLDRKEKSEADTAHLTEEIGDLLLVLQTAIINHGLDPKAIARSMTDKIVRTENLFDNMERNGNI